MAEPISPAVSSDRAETYQEASRVLLELQRDGLEPDALGIGKDLQGSANAGAASQLLGQADADSNVSDAEIQQLSLLAQEFALDGDSFTSTELDKFFSEVQNASSLAENESESGVSLPTGPDDDGFSWPEKLPNEATGSNPGGIEEPRAAARLELVDLVASREVDNPDAFNQLIEDAYADPNISDQEFKSLRTTVINLQSDVVTIDGGHTPGGLSESDLKPFQTAINNLSESNQSRDIARERALDTIDSIELSDQNPGEAEAATRELLLDLEDNTGSGTNDVSDNELGTFANEAAGRASDGDIDWQDYQQLEQLAGRLTALFDENGARINPDVRNPLDQQVYTEDPNAQGEIMVMAVESPEANRQRDFAAVVNASQNTDGLYGKENPGDAERGLRYLMADALGDSPTTDTPDNIDGDQITNQEYSDLSQYAVQLAADGDFDWDDLNALQGKVDTKLL